MLQTFHTFSIGEKDRSWTMLHNKVYESVWRGFLIHIMTIFRIVKRQQPFTKTEATSRYRVWCLRSWAWGQGLQVWDTKSGTKGDSSKFEVTRVRNNSGDRGSAGNGGDPFHFRIRGFVVWRVSFAKLRGSMQNSAEFRFLKNCLWEHHSH